MVVMTQRIVIRLIPRECECCGGSDLESLWRHQFEARTRSGSYLFDTCNVICRDCGFVFVSPAYCDDDLAAYYADAFPTFSDQTLDYDVDLRLALLTQHDPEPGAFVEVGGNQHGVFQTALRARYASFQSVEINKSVESDWAELATLGSESADTLAHYFVLEHIPRVRSFLTDCRRVLKPRGLMICEVPDLALYPFDPVALSLYEHTNHFSQGTFAALAGNCGFEIVEFAQASRTYGFAAVCRSARVKKSSALRTEYEQAKETFLAGLEKLKSKRLALTAGHSKMLGYIKHGELFIVWAANDIAAEFFNSYPELRNLLIIDSDPTKVGSLCGHRVVAPAAAAKDLAKAHAIFICTRRHAGEILRVTDELYGKRWSPENVHILDYK